MVEVRSKEEILATLGPDGTLEGMPFMPEMLKYCGQKFEVGAVAHKTCETARRTWQGRKLEQAVHLADLRCDGAAHGGCQADCRFYWKDAWLKPAGETASAPRQAKTGGCTEAALQQHTQEPPAVGQQGIRYACQATKVFNATSPLPWWNPWQYVRDVSTGNHRATDVLRFLWLAMMRSWLNRTPRGYKVVKAIRETCHRWLVGGEVPDVEGVIPQDQPTPTARLDLKPGERVRVKPKHEIIQTLHVDMNKNRGLSFDQEMVRFCGTIATVRRSVTQIINEGTGEMMRMKQPCIILQGGVCTGQYSQCRLMCPRELPAFWRELWLERVDPPAPGKAATSAPEAELTSAGAGQRSL
jgi:hypothetical protein